MRRLLSLLAICVSVFASLIVIDGLEADTPNLREFEDTPYRFDCSMGNSTFTYNAIEYFPRGGLYWIKTGTGNFYRLPIERCIMWEAKREE